MRALLVPFQLIYTMALKFHYYAPIATRIFSGSAREHFADSDNEDHITRYM